MKIDESPWQYLNRKGEEIEKQRTDRMEQFGLKKSRPMYYTLDENKNPVPCGLGDWAYMFDDIEKRRVDETKFDNIRISTEFIGMDHNLSENGPPILFETMIFGGPHDGYQERYETWDEAVRGHAKAVAIAKGDYAGA